MLQQLAQEAEAFACFDEAVRICRPLSEKSDAVALVLSQALDNKANALVELGRMNEALRCYDDAIQIHEGFVRGSGTPKDMREMAISMMNKGRARMLLNHHEKAQECFDLAEPSLAQYGQCDDYARLVQNVADLLFRQGRYEAAVERYDAALYFWEDFWPLSPETKDDPKSEYAHTLCCKADAFRHLGQLEEAFDATDRAIPLHRAALNLTNGPREREDLAGALKQHGDILSELGRAGEAQDFFREASNLKQKADG
jgi:tetratricopeptide (TPR) repeat protein